MTPLTGGTLRSLDTAACERWLDLVTAATPAAHEVYDLAWLLAHCDDGVVWGRRQGGNWRLSSSAFPEVSPEPRRDNLQQLRLFGLLREVLLWKADGGWQGRELADAETPSDEPLRPQEQDYVLLGDRLLASVKDGFTLVGDGRGSRHAVPLVCEEAQFGAGPQRRWPLRLQVRHYFTADSRSGVVRVAASRLVHVKLAS
jgi:CRISPR-associated protein (TIGR03984 family)